MTVARFLSAEEARRTRSAKWSAHGPDVIAAWVAELDVAIAEPVREALIEAAQWSMTGYPWPEADETQAVISRWHQTRFGQRFDPENILFAPHVMSASAQALAVWTRPGDRLVLSTPLYFPFFMAAEDAGLEQVRVSMIRESTRFRMDIEALESAAAGGGVMVLCNPHNPTGSVATREELEAFADIARRHGNPVLADEIHSPLTYPGAEFLPFSELAPDLADRTMTVTSASKAFNLPGLRFAWIATSSSKLTQQVNGLPFSLRNGVSSIGAPATRAALSDGLDWLDDLIVQLDERRRELDALVATHLPAANYLSPQASFLAWLDLRAYALGDDPAQELLGRGVALSPGPAFGEEGLGHARLNFGCSTETLEAIFERLTPIG